MERIYFSRGNDPHIYRERKELGGALVDKILWEIQHEVEDSVFTYIPNTAEMAYFGLMERLNTMHREVAARRITEELEAGYAYGGSSCRSADALRAAWRKDCH